MGKNEMSASFYNTDTVINQLWWPWVGIHIWNCLNKFADLRNAKEALQMIASFSSYFHWSDAQPIFFSALPSVTFPLCHIPSQKNKHGCNYMYQSYMHDGRRHFQHATKLYKLPKSSPIFMCVYSFLYKLIMRKYNQPNWTNSRV